MPLDTEDAKETHVAFGIGLDEAAQLAELLLQQLPPDEVHEICRHRDEYHRHLH